MSQTSYRERRGAHRPPGLGPAGAIPWFLAAVAVLAIVGYATGWWGGGSSDGEGAKVTTNSQSSTGSATKSTPKTTAKSTATSTPSSPATSTQTQPASTVDPTQPITVLNATSTKGLAAGAATKLRGAGWTIDSTGNYRTGVPGTTVFYGKASLAATAQQVAKDLGGNPQVQESADFGTSKVTVVLASDYAP